MARIVTIGPALQNIYMVDRDDLKPTAIGSAAVFGKVLVGATVEIDKVLYTVGGSGINSAVTLARGGHEVIYFGNVSRDAAGETVLSALDHEGIDSSYVGFLPGKATGSAVTLLDAGTHESTLLLHPGASERFNNFRAEDLEMTQPDYVYFNSLGGDFDKYDALLAAAKSKKVSAKVVFRPGIKEMLNPRRVLGLLSSVDILVVNKKQAAALVPGSLLLELLYRLNNYVPLVAITDGAMGGIVGDRESGEMYRFGVYEDVRVRDFAGAGDAFAAGLVSKLASSKSLRTAATFASANATSVVSAIGETTGVLNGTESLHPMPIQKL